MYHKGRGEICNKKKCINLFKKNPDMIDIAMIHARGEICRKKNMYYFMWKKADTVDITIYYKARGKVCSEKKHVLIYKIKNPGTVLSFPSQ